MKILINTSHLSLLSGVSNHYLGLKKFWSHEVYYNSIGTRHKVPGIVLLPFDILKFIVLCIWIRPNVILLNPSLGIKAIKRDALYLRITKALNIKAIVFIHGWSVSMEHVFDKNPNKFLNMYQRANGFLVLANEFRCKLKVWGIKSPIHLTTTKVDDELLSNFSMDNKPNNIDILYLARVEKEKGVFIVIDAFITLKKNYPKLRLIIAGDGSALSDAQDFVLKAGVSDINFTGRISGEPLKNAFRNNSIYILPTSHGEGMPTSILEAMAFGQVIITAPIGGIKDFFEEDKMGYLIKTYDPDDYAEKISFLIQNADILKRMQHYNFEYAKKNFMASNVAPQIETLIKKTIG